MEEIEKKVEALLFSSTKPLSIDEISKIIDAEKEKVRIAIENLKKRYENSAIEIAETPEGFEMRIKPEYRKEASKVALGYDLSKGMIKTLALVIYKNPIKQSEIVKIQGNRAYEYVEKLERKGLVKTKKIGKTKLVYLSENIEKYFGMSLKEIKEQIEKAVSSK
jgi:segregation and condensation protein B